MFGKTKACVGMTLLMCAAVPADAPGAASPVAASFRTAEAETLLLWPPSAPGVVPGPTLPASASASPAHSSSNTSTVSTQVAGKFSGPAHRRFHRIRHRTKVAANWPVAEMRSQIAETVGLLNQMDENVRNQLAQSRAETARLTVALDGQANQLSLLDKRLNGIDDRQGNETLDRRQETAVLQTRLAQHTVRLDGTEQQLANLTGARANAPMFVAAGLAGLGLLFAIIALVISYRHRKTAVAQAEDRADRLFRTYREEFESLMQAARDLEARLAKTPLPAPAPAMRLYPEGTPVGARV